MGPSAARTYDLYDLPRLTACARSACRGGGLDLHATAAYFESGKHHFNCLGHVGNGPAASPCDNHFEVTLTIKRSPNTVGAP
ncbi:MAG: hypothetical protein A4S17_00470 [Proteobacteria bacterium HN_bin10]|nr:MAG: hypothetical protein A4S17_00470 [Proteobacteria bacterium HN_bin10]